jgi:hypothetical protein
MFVIVYVGAYYKCIYACMHLCMHACKFMVLWNNTRSFLHIHVNMHGYIDTPNSKIRNMRTHTYTVGLICMYYVLSQAHMRIHTCIPCITHVTFFKTLSLSLSLSLTHTHKNPHTILKKDPPPPTHTCTQGPPPPPPHTHVHKDPPPPTKESTHTHTCIFIRIHSWSHTPHTCTQEPTHTHKNPHTCIFMRIHCWSYIPIHQILSEAYMLVGILDLLLQVLPCVWVCMYVSIPVNYVYVYVRVDGYVCDPERGVYARWYPRYPFASSAMCMGVYVCMYPSMYTHARSLGSMSFWKLRNVCM